MVANNFNRHFADLPLQFSGSMDCNFISEHVSLNNSSVFMPPVCPADVLSLVNNLKSSNAAGFDEISNNFLKKCRMLRKGNFSS